jgi:signal transduction histidine kinase
LDQHVNSHWIVGAIQDGYLRVDRQGAVLEANLAATRMLSDTGDPLCGRMLTALFPQFKAPQIERLLSGSTCELAETVTWPPTSEEGATKGPFRLTGRTNGEDLEIVIVDLGRTPRLEAELTQLKATMAVSHELLRHKNKELDQSLERMARINEQLAAVDGLKSQFLSNISHELRTPLNTIIGSLQLVREGMCDDRREEEEYNKSALAAACELLAIITEMLDSAKLSAGKMHFLIEDHAVTALFEEAYCHAAPAAREKGLELEFIEEGEGDLFIRADFEKVRQVLFNIVANSIKYSESGTISIKARLSAEDPDLVEFVARDQGIGIPQDRQAAIFDRFTRVDDQQTHRHHGAGLGLALTKSLVEMMGGSIRLHSDGLNQGTEVRFSLPAGSGSGKETPGGEISAEEIQNQLPMTF